MAVRTLRDLAGKVKHIDVPMPSIRMRGSAIVAQPPSNNHALDCHGDRHRFAADWTTDLDRWFAYGVETSGLVATHVGAARVHYWDGKGEGDRVA